jgi:hypothetical protein
MGKDPAFLFYPNDYLGGTMGFSIEQHGLYIIALIFQFNHGSFSEQQINSLLNGKFDLIKHKFETDGKLFWNERLNTEKEKRKLYTESRKRNGRCFILKKDKPLINTQINTEHMGIPSIPHMEDENRNKNKDEIEFELFRKSYPGSKRGLETELENLKKKHDDWKTVLLLLNQALINQKAWRTEMATAGMFIPEWPGLAVWINQRRWENEKPVIEIKNTNKSPILEFQRKAADKYGNLPKASN